MADASTPLQHPEGEDAAKRAEALRARETAGLASEVAEDLAALLGDGCWNFLAQMLGSPKAKVRLYALSALQHVGPGAAPHREAVEARLRHDPDAGVRAKAAEILRGLPGPAARRSVVRIVVHLTGG